MHKMPDIEYLRQINKLDYILGFWNVAISRHITVLHIGYISDSKLCYNIKLSLVPGIWHSLIRLKVSSMALHHEIKRNSRN